MSLIIKSEYPVSFTIRETFTKVMNELDIKHLGIYGNTLTYYKSDYSILDTSLLKEGSDEFLLVSVLTEYMVKFLSKQNPTLFTSFSDQLFNSFFVNFTKNYGFPLEFKKHEVEEIHNIQTWDGYKEYIEENLDPYILYIEADDSDIPLLHFKGITKEWNDFCKRLDIYYPGFNDMHSIPVWVQSLELGKFYHEFKHGKDIDNELLMDTVNNLFVDEITYLTSLDTYIDVSFSFDKGPVLHVKDINNIGTIYQYLDGSCIIEEKDVIC